MTDRLEFDEGGDIDFAPLMPKILDNQSHFGATSLVLLAGRCQSAKWQVAVGYAWLADGTRENGGGRWFKRLFGYVGLSLSECFIVPQRPRSRPERSITAARNQTRCPFAHPHRRAWSTIESSRCRRQQRNSIGFN